jgi:glycosyltransferase involved in cell wall biosynthesis
VKILFTSTAYPPSIGGAQFYAHYTIRELADTYTVQVVTHWDEPRTDWLLGTTLRSPAEQKSYNIDNVQVARLGLNYHDRLSLVPWVLLYYPLQGVALRQVARLLAGKIRNLNFQPDLVHNIRIGREGLSYASLQIARERGVPFVFSPLHHPRWGTWLHRYYHKLYRDADALIALTEAERQTLIGLGANENKVHVTGTGPVLAEAGDAGTFRAAYHLQDAPIVLFIGQKYEYKGIRLLLDATGQVWQKHPDVYFIFMGPRTSYSRQLFNAVSDKRILELDAVSTQMKTNALAACTVLCLPSTQESFGSVFTEAWSMGKPVIGCDIPAVKTVIEDGVDGFVISPVANVLADRLIYLLDHPGQAIQMGEAGLQKTNRLYTWSRLAERTEQVYQAVLKG